MHIITQALLESAVQVALTGAAALVGLAAAWLSSRIGKYHAMKTLQLALEEAGTAAQTTALELQQTVVEQLKAAAADGKLTAQEIQELNRLLQEKTLRKLSAVSAGILTAAGVDLTALITGAAEALLADLRSQPEA